MIWLIEYATMDCRYCGKNRPAFVCAQGFALIRLTMVGAIVSFYYLYPDLYMKSVR